jgi:hypothetical protein
VHHERHIVLGSNEIGCRVARCPKDVRMSKKRKDFLTWHISNSSDQGSSCDRRVEVCIGNWRLAGQSVDAPVQGRGGGALRRWIPPRHRPIPLQVVIAENAPTGTYSYDILIDGTRARDPMLEIVP